VCKIRSCISQLPPTFIHKVAPNQKLGEDTRAVKIGEGYEISIMINTKRSQYGNLRDKGCTGGKGVREGPQKGIRGVLGRTYLL
jgi:hypothetical protein